MTRSERNLVSDIFGEPLSAAPKINAAALWEIIASIDTRGVLSRRYDSRTLRVKLSIRTISAELGVEDGIIRQYVAMMLRRLRHPSRQTQYVVASNALRVRCPNCHTDFIPESWLQ